MLETMAATDTDLLAAELRALNDSCGVVDRSDRGKLALTGAGAIEFLNGQVTNELADVRVGEGRYAAFLTHKGKMLGDVRILAVGDGADDGGGAAPGELLLDTERVALQELFNMIRRFKLGSDVELHKRTVETALLSLLGPDLAAHGACRVRPHQREQRLLERALVQLGLPAHRAAAQGVEERLERHALGVEPELRAGVDDPQVGQHLALVGQQGGVAAAAGRERLDVVRDLAGEQLLGLGPGQRELAALGAIDERDLLGQQAVGGCGLDDGGGHPSRVVQSRLTPI